jgi:hypothetical protein
LTHTEAFGYRLYAPGLHDAGRQAVTVSDALGIIRDALTGLAHSKHRGPAAQTAALDARELIDRAAKIVEKSIDVKGKGR